MTETGAGKHAEGGLRPVPQAVEIARTLGLVINTTMLYSPVHSVTKGVIENCFRVLAHALGETEEILFTITDDRLMINHVAIEQKNPLIRTFVSCLAGLDTGSFSLSRGLTQERFEKLIRIMTARPEQLKQWGGFSGALAAEGVDGVKARKVTYRQVEEGEADADKDKTGVERGGETPGLDEAQGVDMILAFLRGDVSTDDEEVLKGVQDVAPDAKRLGDLIMHAAEVKMKAADIGQGETLTDIVVGCLRRVHQALSKDRSAKGRQARKGLQKTLLLLEKEIVDRMRKAAEEFDPEDEAAVCAATEEMVDQLKVETLASEYMKSRRAAEKTQKRLLRAMQAKGAKPGDRTALAEGLAAEGLTPEGWQELLVKSGAASGAGVQTGAGDEAGPGGLGRSDGGAIGRLATLLTRMMAIGSAEKGVGKAAEEDLAGIIADVNREVTVLAEAAERRLQHLAENIKSDEAVVDAAERTLAGRGMLRMSRKKLLELLAEIAQELCQPLAVINCALDMMRSRKFGAVAHAQVDMLNLATESGLKLQKIVQKLIEIAGMPMTMSPDAAVLASLYGQKG